MKKMRQNKLYMKDDVEKDQSEICTNAGRCQY